MNNIKVSSNFMYNAFLSILLIGLFAVVYILMLSFAIVLSLFCVYWGGIIAFWIFTHYPSVRGLIGSLFIGAVVISFGVIILIFLVKFMFATHKRSRFGLIEIYDEDNPELVKMIKEIVRATGANFPKHIYLTRDVNASVFFDSSFWSMFFPVKKNLVIGMGLINTSTKDELKAVLSHEFGHFSQQSMKIGSYIYHVNVILNDILFDNRSFWDGVEKWASNLGTFAVIMNIDIYFIRFIQFIAKQLYALINKRYLALSREMEFNADAIAANITGSDALISSLLRMQLTTVSFDSTLSFYSNQNEIESENIYPSHLFVTNFFAELYHIEIKNQLPNITIEQNQKIDRSKLNIKDQWTSHPSIKDRVRALKKLNISKENEDTSLACGLINNWQSYCELLTKYIFFDSSKDCLTYNVENGYFDVVRTRKPNIIEEKKFKEEFVQPYDEVMFAKIYGNYYNRKDPVFFSIDELDSVQIEDISDFFSKEKTEMFRDLSTLSSDLSTIKQIYENKLKVRSFDYNEIRYYRNKKQQVQQLIQQLEDEYRQLSDVNIKNDNAIYSYFYFKAKEKGVENEFLARSNKLSYYYKTYDDCSAISYYLTKSLAFLHSGVQMNYETVNLYFKDVSHYEDMMKNELQKMLKNSTCLSLMNDKTKKQFEYYIANKLDYAGVSGYFFEAINILYGVRQDFENINKETIYTLKKDFLDYQMTLI